MRKALWTGEPVECSDLDFSEDLWRVIDKVGTQGEANPHYKSLRPMAARWLAAVIVSEGSRNAVELGTYSGFSTLHIAGALAITGGHLTTYEKFEDRAELAISAIEEAGLAEIVTVCVDDGVRALGEAEGSIDLLFMDILPADYTTALNNAKHRIQPGSIVVADNMLSHRDSQGVEHKGMDAGAQEYQQFVETQPDCVSTLLDLGSGLLVAQLK
jgi:predicted O-methyltransferase YrrM